MVTALIAFRAAFPDHRKAEVASAVEGGLEYVRAQQRDDGSWYGSWAVCFTYGTWFGVEALVAGGNPADAPRLAAAATFLLAMQRTDGGWGETYLSCLTKNYSHGPSNAVNTAWAVLALAKAGAPGTAHAVQRGVAWLVADQGADGDWPQAGVAGIFNRTCGITYTAYRNLFPLWALGVVTAGEGAPASPAAAKAVVVAKSVDVVVAAPSARKRASSVRRRS